jgi:hypothetical protein
VPEGYSQINEQAEGDIFLVVEVERSYLILYHRLKEELEYQEWTVEDTSEVNIGRLEQMLIAGETPRMRAKMIAKKSPMVSAKAMTEAEDGDLVRGVFQNKDRVKKLSEVYQECSNPEMGARDTLDWMTNNGYLASGLASCENPLDILFGKDVMFPKRDLLSGIDFTFRPEYSRFMNAVNQSEKDHPPQDFIEEQSAI